MIQSKDKNPKKKKLIKTQSKSKGKLKCDTEYLIKVSSK